MFRSRRRLRKSIYFALFIIAFFSISFGYAFLSTSLTISGKSAINKNTWNLHFKNIRITEGSVSATIEPIIESSNQISNFKFILDKRGDYYEFSVDIENSGTIDAMIDSIEKTPELSDAQKKYLNYTIEYENGEQILKNQLIKSGESVKIKVRVEFKNNITASDLPQTQQILNLGFKVNYVQSDKNGVAVKDNGKVINILSGDGTHVGDEVCIKDECFYVISSTSEKITMLSKYNLHVGNKYDDTNGAIPLVNPTEVQNSNAIGWFTGYSEENPIIGGSSFANDKYWTLLESEYPFYVYGENSNLYSYVENYKGYLDGLGVRVENARLITVEELEVLGCSILNESCSAAPSFVSLSSYWTGSAGSSNSIYVVYNSGYFRSGNYTSSRMGVRPVIEIDRSLVTKKPYADGDINEVGTVVTIGTEQFYTIGTEVDNVKLLSMYNLYVGNECISSSSCTPYGEEATGMQDSMMQGNNTTPYRGVTAFSSSTQHGTNYTDYKGSIVEGYVNNYKTKLEEKFGIEVEDARLITKDDLISEKIGCSITNTGGICLNAPTWIYSIEYWTGAAYDINYYVWAMDKTGYLHNIMYNIDYGLGVRPVIVVPKSYFE